MVVAVERKGKGGSRMYGRGIETASNRPKRKNIKKFMGEHIRADAQVHADGWTGYKGLESEFPKLIREQSEKKERISPTCTTVL
jgi:hypothetical protein